MNALFPELVSGIAGLVNQILPGKGGIGEDHATRKRKHIIYFAVIFDGKY